MPGLQIICSIQLGVLFVLSDYSISLKKIVAKIGHTANYYSKIKMSERNYIQTHNYEPPNKHLF